MEYGSESSLGTSSRLSSNQNLFDKPANRSKSVVLENKFSNFSQSGQSLTLDKINNDLKNKSPSQEGGSTPLELKGSVSDFNDSPSETSHKNIVLKWQRSKSLINLVPSHLEYLQSANKVAPIPSKITISSLSLNASKSDEMDSITTGGSSRYLEWYKENQMQNEVSKMMEQVQKCMELLEWKVDASFSDSTIASNRISNANEKLLDVEAELSIAKDLKAGSKSSGINNLDKVENEHDIFVNETSLQEPTPQVPSRSFQKSQESLPESSLKVAALISESGASQVKDYKKEQSERLLIEESLQATREKEGRSIPLALKESVSDFERSNPSEASFKNILLKAQKSKSLVSPSMPTPLNNLPSANKVVAIPSNTSVSPSSIITSKSDEMDSITTGGSSRYLEWYMKNQIKNELGEMMQQIQNYMELLEKRVDSSFSNSTIASNSISKGSEKLLDVEAELSIAKDLNAGSKSSGINNLDKVENEHDIFVNETSLQEPTPQVPSCSFQKSQESLPESSLKVPALISESVASLVKSSKKERSENLLMEKSLQATRDVEKSEKYQQDEFIGNVDEVMSRQSFRTTRSLTTSIVLSNSEVSIELDADENTIKRQILEFGRKKAASGNELEVDAEGSRRTLLETNNSDSSENQIQNKRSVATNDTCVDLYFVEKESEVQLNKSEHIEVENNSNNQLDLALSSQPSVATIDKAVDDRENQQIDINNNSNNRLDLALSLTDSSKTLHYDWTPDEKDDRKADLFKKNSAETMFFSAVDISIQPEETESKSPDSTKLEDNTALDNIENPFEAFKWQDGQQQSKEGSGQSLASIATQQIAKNITLATPNQESDTDVFTLFKEMKEQRGCDNTSLEARKFDHMPETGSFDGWTGAETNKKMSDMNCRVEEMLESVQSCIDVLNGKSNHLIMIKPTTFDQADGNKFDISKSWLDKSNGLKLNNSIYELFAKKSLKVLDGTDLPIDDENFKPDYLKKRDSGKEVSQIRKESLVNYADMIVNLKPRRRTIKLPEDLDSSNIFQSFVNDGVNVKTPTSAPPLQSVVESSFQNKSGSKLPYARKLSESESSPRFSSYNEFVNSRVMSNKTGGNLKSLFIRDDDEFDNQSTDSLDKLDDGYSDEIQKALLFLRKNTVQHQPHENEEKDVKLLENIDQLLNFSSIWKLAGQVATQVKSIEKHESKPIVRSPSSKIEQLNRQPSDEIRFGKHLGGRLADSDWMEALFSYDLGVEPGEHLTQSQSLLVVTPEEKRKSLSRSFSESNMSDPNAKQLEQQNFQDNLKKDVSNNFDSSQFEEVKAKSSKPVEKVMSDETVDKTTEIPAEKELSATSVKPSSATSVKPSSATSVKQSSATLPSAISATYASATSASATATWVTAASPSATSASATSGVTNTTSKSSNTTFAEVDTGKKGPSKKSSNPFLKALKRVSPFKLKKVNKLTKKSSSSKKSKVSSEKLEEVQAPPTKKGPKDWYIVKKIRSMASYLSLSSSSSKGSDDGGKKKSSKKTSKSESTARRPISEDGTSANLTSATSGITNTTSKDSNTTFAEVDNQSSASTLLVNKLAVGTSRKPNTSQKRSKNSENRLTPYYTPKKAQNFSSITSIQRSEYSNQTEESYELEYDVSVLKNKKTMNKAVGTSMSEASTLSVINFLNSDNKNELVKTYVARQMSTLPFSMSPKPDWSIISVPLSEEELLSSTEDPDAGMHPLEILHNVGSVSVFVVSFNILLFSVLKRVHRSIMA